MSAFVVSLLFAIGAGTWIYTRFQRSSGNNTKQSLIAAGFCAAVLFILFFFAFRSILNR